MYTETDFLNYSKPAENNWQEFIVCLRLPGCEQRLYSYADLKNFLFKFEDTSPVICNFPNVAMSDKIFDNFLNQINCRKNTACIFINISSYLKNDNFENLNRLQSLCEFFKNQREKVFNVFVYTDEIREARSLYEKYFISDFQWTIFD